MSGTRTELPDLSRRATAARIRNAMPPLPFTGLTAAEYGRHIDAITRDVMQARRFPRNPYRNRHLDRVEFPTPVRTTNAAASSPLGGTREAAAGGTA